MSLIRSAGHGGEREHAQAPPQRDEGDPGGRGPEVGGSKKEGRQEEGR